MSDRNSKSEGLIAVLGDAAGEVHASVPCEGVDLWAPAILGEHEQPTEPISGAIATDRGATRGGVQPEAHVLRKASEIAASVRGGANARSAHAILVGLTSAYPSCERLQILAARVAEAFQPDAESARTWEGVQRRFPTSVEPFRLTVRWTMRGFGREAALRRLRECFPLRPHDPSSLCLYAWGHEELRNFVEADVAFERLIALGEHSEAAYLQFVQALLKRGEIWRACRVLAKGKARVGASTALDRAMVAALAERDELEIAASPSIRDGRASIAILQHIFTRLAETRRRPRFRRSVGRVMMITGTLGAGGAERQLALTAAALQRAASRRDETIAGHRVLGPVEVFCRSLRDRPGANFFEGALRAADVAVYEYARLAPLAARGCASITSRFQDGIRFLPGPMAEGVAQLADEIRARAPHVVQIWQDGSIFAAGLAALMAGAPRIVLNVRSLPPIDRPERYKPEHDLLFRSLLAQPGVTLTANSQAVARRYAEWLCLDQDGVEVVYNGVEPLGTDPAPEDRELAARFDAATPAVDYTVGCVMRLDDNKRPLFWLEAAARLQAQAPGTRFIIIGDGPLREACVSHAQRLEIADRVLFVGRSHRVGFWLSQMDTFMLLSRVEGMPNVLIEAQHAGIPVVTTDAGGAAEAIDADVTGILLPSPTLSSDAVAAELLALRADPERRAGMGREGRRWAKATFSEARMVERTVQTFMA